MRKRMRWGRARRCGGGSGGERDDAGGGEEDEAARRDLGENGRGDGGGCPLYMMGRFGHVHGHVLHHDRGLACAHVYAAPLVS